jgi:hypothetical protein
MDGLVLVLAAILNPRAKRDAQREEQRSRDGAHSTTDGSTATAAMLATVVQEK